MMLSSSFPPYSLAPAKNPVKQVTPGPKEQNERKPTDVQSQTQPPEQADLPGRSEPALSQTHAVRPRGGESGLWSSLPRTSWGPALRRGGGRLSAQHLKPLFQQPAWALGFLQAWELAPASSIQLHSTHFLSNSILGANCSKHSGQTIPI